MGEVHAMSSGIQCPRSCAGYSAAAGMLAAGRDGAVDCEAVVVPHAQSDQAVATSTMACMRFVRRNRFLAPEPPRPLWKSQASMTIGHEAASEAPPRAPPPPAPRFPNRNPA